MKFLEVIFVYLDVCIDIKILIRHSKSQIDVQSFLQGGFYQNYAQFSEIRKYKKNDDLSFNYSNHSLLSQCDPSPS